MVRTDDHEAANEVRVLLNYGGRHRNLIRVQGLNSRLDELQGVGLRVKLRHLD